MEFLEGKALKEVISSAPMKLEDVYTVVSQIADGLDAATPSESSTETSSRKTFS